MHSIFTGRTEHAELSRSSQPIGSFPLFTTGHVPLGVCRLCIVTSLNLQAFL
jgi:hypothetical protein